MKRSFAIVAVALALLPNFAEAKKRPKPKEPDTKPPVITHVRVTKTPRGKPLTIRARFEDANEIFAPCVYVREKGTVEFDTLPMKRAENGYEVVLSAERMEKDVEYFIEAFDEEGNGPSREGSPDQPLTIGVFEPGTVFTEPKEETPPVEPDQPPPQLKKDPPPPPPGSRKDNTAVTQPDLRDRYDEPVTETWWFWTIIGVVVTGGIAGTVVLLQQGGGPVDEVDIQVIGPDPTAGI
jgi:hypothetical protein